MANRKLSDHTAITGANVNAAADYIEILDVSDTTDAGSGTNKKILPSELLIAIGAEPAKGADDNYVTDAEKVVIGNTSGTNTGDQNLSGYLLSSTAASTYEPLKDSDENFVTDAQLVVIGNTSGTNTGDQDLSSYVTASSTTTLTNKRLTPRVQAVTSAATVTPNSDNDDLVTITAQAEALTIANPSGTPVSGQALLIRIKDNGTARAITFGSEYRAIGVTLPSTTVISKTMYIGLMRNAADTKWDVIGLSKEA